MLFREDNSEVVKHKKSLEKLKEQDPEFYEFLQQEDSGLLDFDASDENSDVDGEEDSDANSDIVHKVPEKHEVCRQFDAFLIVVSKMRSSDSQIISCIH